MALKDQIDKLVRFFEIDDSEEYVEVEENLQPQGQPQPPKATLRVAPVQATSQSESNSSDHLRNSRPEGTPIQRSRQASSETPSRSQRATSHLHDLHQRQRELSDGMEKSRIDIKFPKRYEDAPEIVDLLIDNRSILIDFQYMSEPQARRCLDYLDGARTVLAGNLKKVTQSTWLLTPMNVVVNVEEIRQMHTSTSYNYDMKR